jgi:hypothetical protein
LRPHTEHVDAVLHSTPGVSLFTLSRRMGTSVEMIDRTYGHLAPDAEDYERGLLDTFDSRLDVGAPAGEAGIAAGRAAPVSVFDPPAQTTPAWTETIARAAAQTNVALRRRVAAPAQTRRALASVSKDASRFAKDPTTVTP